MDQRRDLGDRLAAARRRVRRLGTARVLAGALLATVLLATVLLAGGGDSGGGNSTLVPAVPAAAAGPLAVGVTAHLEAADGTRLQVGADPTPVPVVGHQTRLRLVWTVPADSPTPVRLPVVGFAAELTADERTAEQGPGAIGVTDGRCSSWDDLGRYVPNSCPPPQDTVLAPGQSTTTGVEVADVVPSGQIAAGTYRLRTPVGSLGVLDLALRVTGRSRPAAPGPGRLTGQVVAVDRRGNAVPGAAPVQATITLRRVRSGALVELTTTPAGGFTTPLAAGGWQVAADAAGGRCIGTGVQVEEGQEQTLVIGCPAPTRR